MIKRLATALVPFAIVAAMLAGSVENAGAAPHAAPSSHAAVVPVKPTTGLVPNMTPNPNDQCPQLGIAARYTQHIDFGGQSSMGKCCYSPGTFTIWDSQNWYVHTDYQSDGNLVTYYRAPGNVWRVGGQTQTYGKQAFEFCLQGDGNAVIYRFGDNYPLWQSYTPGCNSNPISCWARMIYAGTFTNGHDRLGSVVGTWKESGNYWYTEWNYILGQSP
ncbi:MAG: hypothetical protein JOY61_08715 [Chloroflexi bacterium]|nr:hypothetical protein [Chloroflexota bacterium]